MPSNWSFRVFSWLVHCNSIIVMRNSDYNIMVVRSKSRSHFVHFHAQCLSGQWIIITRFWHFEQLNLKCDFKRDAQFNWANLSGLFSFARFIFIYEKCSLILNRSPWIMESSPVYRISNLSIIRSDLFETFARLCVCVFGYCFAFFILLFIHIYHDPCFKRTSTVATFSSTRSHKNVFFDQTKKNMNMLELYRLSWL